MLRSSIPTPLHVLAEVTWIMEASHLAFPEIARGELPVLVLVEAGDVDTPGHEHRPLAVGDVFQGTLHRTSR